jgi:hypothetical protein
VAWRIPGLSVRTAWQAVRAACARGNRDVVKIFVGGQPLPRGPAWPDKTPASSDPWSWVAALDAPTYFAYARNAQSYDRELFVRVVEAFASLVAKQGIHSGPTEVEVFLGDYQYTPGGIHRESCSNIHLVLHGTKTMYFWPRHGWPTAEVPRRLTHAEGTGTTEEYLAWINPSDVVEHADRLTAGAGGGFAWRAGTWHVAETHGPSIAVNIASYQHSLDGERPLPLWTGQLTGAVPTDWLRQYAAHIGSAYRPGTLLARLSSLNMTTAPPRRPARRGRSVRWRLDVPIVWTADSDRLIVAALGEARRFGPAELVAEWLSSRGPIGHQSEVKQRLADLAAWLHRQGVVDVEDGELP